MIWAAVIIGWRWKPHGGIACRARQSEGIGGRMNGQSGSALRDCFLRKIIMAIIKVYSRRY